MDKNEALMVEEDDPRVIAALEAEQRLFTFYGLKAVTHFVTLQHFGIRIRVLEFGSGEPVLFVPGNVGPIYPLASLMAELKGRRIIAVERPGGGISDGIDHRKVDFRELAVHTLISVLDAFGLDKAPIVGHSIGGHWSLWLALDRPERVSSITLLGVPGALLDTSPPFVLRLLSVPILNRFLYDRIMPSNAEQSLRGMSFIGHSPETVARQPEAMADCYYHFPRLPHSQTSTLSLMEVTNRLRGARPEIRIGEEDLKSVQQPTMFIWGDNDPFGRVEIGRHISEMIPSSEFHAIKGGGHLPWLDDPVECGRLTQIFLSSH